MIAKDACGICFTLTSAGLDIQFLLTTFLSRSTIHIALQARVSACENNTGLHKRIAQQARVSACHGQDFINARARRSHTLRTVRGRNEIKLLDLISNRRISYFTAFPLKAEVNQTAPPIHAESEYLFFESKSHRPE